MPSPPPVLPPIRFPDIDLPLPPHHLATLEGTVVPATSSMNDHDSEQGQAGSRQHLGNAVNQPAHNPSPPPVADHIIHESHDHDHDADHDHDHGPNDDDLDDDDDDDDDDDAEGDGDMDSEDDELDRDGEMIGDDTDPYPWRPIAEDTSLPCEDEQAFIDGKEEHSAEKHTYWEQETFFDLDDPSMPTMAQGRIQWDIAAFNGTKEKPNKQLVMRSPVVRIGDHDWQIKMFPHGDRTEFISVYIECLTMSKPDFQDQVPFDVPPLPVMEGSPHVERRVSVAAQVAVVMYNPAEPRVHEHKIDAHQFHKHSADFGWKYFTSEPRYDFYLRKHGQRQAILRNDKLSLTAYIRIINDPTGCLWENTAPPEGRPSATSLQSYDSMSPRMATYLLLFHLPLFRRWLCDLVTPESPTISLLQDALRLFLNRRLDRKFLRHQVPGGCDIVNVLHGLRGRLSNEVSVEILAAFDTVMGSLDPNKTPITHNRLLTAKFDNIQQAIDAHEIKKDTPAVLTLELERQRFDKVKRRWVKVDNPVDLQDSIRYGSRTYILYGFVTHSGALGSPNYVPHIRPGGIGGLWYAYDAKFVKCLTQKAAKGRQLGHKIATKAQVPLPGVHPSSLPVKQENASVAYLAMYIREDRCPEAFPASATEDCKDKRPDAMKLEDRQAAGSRPTRFDAKSAITSTSAAPTDIPPRIPNLPNAVMDGDDVIMSDVEDNILPHSYSNNSSQAASATKNRQELLKWKCTNYFAGPYYNGTTLSDGKYHGQGWLINTNGDEYTGDFKHNKADGEGTMIYAETGDQYTGTWLAGQHHGQGILREKRTGNMYEGGWQHGRRRGSFTLTGKVTEDDKQYCQICCEREMSVAFYDCGHVLACKQCAAALHTCPICRKQIAARLELFGVKVSML